MAMIRSLWDYRGFIAASVRRDMRLRYAGSALGAVWQVLSPLAMITIYTLVFAELMRSRLAGVDDQYGYAIFVCCGLLAWTMFSEVLLRAQTMFLENANLLKKARFPRTCIPAVVIGSALANFAVVYGVFLALLALSGRWPGAVVICAAPLLLLLALLALAIGILLGIGYVFFRDVGHVLAIVLQLWFWLTPIVYPATILPQRYAHLLELNPLSPIVRGLQDIFLHREAPLWSAQLFPAALTAALLAIALLAFRRQSPWIVDEL